MFQGVARILQLKAVCPNVGALVEYIISWISDPSCSQKSSVKSSVSKFWGSSRRYVFHKSVPRCSIEVAITFQFKQ